MNSPNPRPATSPEAGELNARILNAVAASRWQGRLLTGLALGFGLLSIAASLAVVLGYFILYRPKEKQIMADYQTMVQAGPPKPEPGADPKVHEAEVRRFAMIGLGMTTTFAIAFCTALIGAAVALLGLGTLVTVTLVIFERRVTLRQVNASLAQISEQLMELPTRTSAGNPNG